MKISVLGFVVTAVGVLLLVLSIVYQISNQYIYESERIFGIVFTIWGIAIIAKPEIARNRRGIFRYIPNAGSDRKKRSA